VKDAEAKEQHKSIIGALKAAALEWEFEQINFVVGNRGSVVESDFYTKLKRGLQQGQRPSWSKRKRIDRTSEGVSQRKRIAAGTATFLVKVKAHRQNQRRREPTFWR